MRVGNGYATGDTVDMTTNDLAVAHELDGCRIALMDLRDRGLLEIPVNPKRIGINKRYIAFANSRIVTLLREQIRNIAIHRRDDARTPEIYTRLIQAG